MGLSHDFTEYYKTISNAELLGILEKPADYQDAALEAAQKEFANRQLSTEEIKEARQVIFEKQLQKAQQRERIKAVENKFRKTGEAVFDDLNPFQRTISPLEKSIRLIVISFTLLFFYQLISQFKTTIYYIKDLPGFPFESGFYLLPQILLPIAIFLFWKRKSIGWILLVAFVTYTTVLAVAMAIQSFFWEPSGFAALDNLYQMPSTTSSLFSLALWAGTLYMLCKQVIRRAYTINDQKMYASIILSGLITVALMVKMD